MQAPHFEHVDLLVDYMSRSVTFTDNAEMIEAQDLGIGSPTPSFRAISIMGLVIDEIQYFEIENDVVYAYTQIFKIDIAKALAHQEITLLENGQLYSKKKRRGYSKGNRRNQRGLGKLYVRIHQHYRNIP
jgi:hypothetical protein